MIPAMLAISQNEKDSNATKVDQMFPSSLITLQRPIEMHIHEKNKIYYTPSFHLHSCNYTYYSPRLAL